jgi:hypothetical protein
MKYSIFTLLLLGIFAFTACNEITVEDELLHNKVERCDFVYPITFVLADGTTKTVDKWEDIGDKQDVKKGDDKKGDDKKGDDKSGDDKVGDEKEAELQFPVEFVSVEGKILTVNNYEELKTAWEACEEEDKYEEEHKDDDCRGGCGG